MPLKNTYYGSFLQVNGNLVYELTEVNFPYEFFLKRYRYLKGRKFYQVTSMA